MKVLALFAVGVVAALATAEALALVLGLAGFVLSTVAIWRTVVLSGDLRDVTDAQTLATESLAERADLLGERDD